MKNRKVALWIVLIFFGLVLAAGTYISFRILKGTEPKQNTSTTAEVFDDSRLPELASEVVLDGLDHVWDIAFFPDGTPVFSEREGKLSTIKNGVASELYVIGNVYSEGEAGLLGITVDPDFENNRYLYACYSTEDDIRISRWKVTDGLNGLLEQTDIVTGMPVNTDDFPGRHSGCRPRFDGKNNLWIGTGDVAVGTNPQDPKSLGGKIIRVDREGHPVEGNLPVPYDPRIFSYGHRNVQGIALFEQPKEGVFGYSVEHGSGVDDEVNVLKTGNFGWDPVPDYNEEVSMTDLVKFPDAISASWSSGDPTIAPSGATILTGENWRAWDGALAMAVLKDKHIRILKFTDTHQLISEQPIFENSFGRIRSVVLGQKSDLYVTTDNGNKKDQIIRIYTKQ